MNIPDNIPEYVKGLRKHLGLSVSEFAVQLGFMANGNIIARYECGLNTPPLKVIQKMMQLDNRPASGAQ